jgi:hypothetical protein
MLTLESSRSLQDVCFYSGENRQQVVEETENWVRQRVVEETENLFTSNREVGKTSNREVGKVWERKVRSHHEEEGDGFPDNDKEQHGLTIQTNWMMMIMMMINKMNT